MAGSSGNLERDIAQWLQTVAVDSADTLRTPNATIVPAGADLATTRSRRALALLEQLAGRSLSTTAQLQPGEIIGEGGMGVVRLAEQVALGRTVAVKTLKPGRRDAAAALDLLREAWITGRLEHPNIVPVHYLGLDDDGSPVIVLKRIEGVEWSKLIGDADAVRDRFGTGDLLAWNLGILLQVLNAVRFAHSRGIVHRDLKPANVMIGEFGEVYLVDWGIAVSLCDDGSGRLPLAADQTEVAGTPCYMAPEMLGRERGPLSERTDIYLAGAVLFEIVAGHPPHDGDSVLAVVTSIATSQPRLPDTTPADLGRIITRAMAAAPDERHDSVEALRLDLLGYLERRGSERLVELAQARLAELRAAIAAGAAREEVYRLFGAARFGFHEALLVWRDNPVARAGMRDATVAIAERELAADDGRAAVNLLAELDDPPAELTARARAQAAAEAARQAELERVRREHDPAIGTRTRTFLAAVLGAIFVGAPFVPIASDYRYVAQHHHELALWSAFLMTVTAGLGFWARDTMMKTAINRRLLATMLFLMVAQMLLALGGWQLGMPVPHVQAFMILLWFAVTGMVAIGIDWRLTPAAIAYAVAFAAVTRWPDQRYWFMSGSNLIFTATALWHWWPSQFRYSAEELEARRRPPR